MIHDEEGCHSLTLNQKLQQFPGAAAAARGAELAREGCSRAASAQIEAQAEVPPPPVTHTPDCERFMSASQSTSFIV